jgi:hypothetical protein
MHYRNNKYQKISYKDVFEEQPISLEPLNTKPVLRTWTMLIILESLYEPIIETNKTQTVYVIHKVSHIYLC